MMGIDEDIPEEAFQQEDSPFDSLSIKNWKEKTVNEFFESDLAVLKLVDKFFLAQLGKAIDEVENQEMGEFYSEFQMLAHNDHIDKSVYQAVENKINRILRDLEEKEASNKLESTQIIECFFESKHKGGREGMCVPTITDKMQLILDSYSPFVTEENEVILGLEDAVLFLSVDREQKGKLIIRIDRLNERVNWTAKEVLGQ